MLLEGKYFVLPGRHSSEVALFPLIMFGINTFPMYRFSMEASLPTLYPHPFAVLSSQLLRSKLPMTSPKCKHCAQHCWDHREGDAVFAHAFSVP